MPRVIAASSGNRGHYVGAPLLAPPRRWGKRERSAAARNTKKARRNTKKKIRAGSARSRATRAAAVVVLTRTVVNPTQIDKSVHVADPPPTTGTGFNQRVLNYK